MRSVEARLNAGDYEGALSLLERAFARGEDEAALVAAEIWSFFGPEEVERLEAALEAARTLADDPRWRALDVLSKVWRGQRARLFRARGAAAYHLAEAALALGEPERALGYLEATGRLPGYLIWRRALLRGRALEALGRYGAAAAAYREALERAPAPERPYLAMDVAATLMEEGRGEAALRFLEAHPPEEENALWHYLRARALLAEGSPRMALEALEEAGRLGGDPYEVALTAGQAWMRLGEPGIARERFEEALAEAREEEKSYVLHELGVAALEAGDLDVAIRSLGEALADPRYPHKGALLAELAAAYYRRGELTNAERWAQEAVEYGAKAAGHLYLGHVALDRGGLREALAHYRAAAEHAEEGSPDWVTAQQLAADVLAQLGFPDPEETLTRAHAALRHTPPYDEWTETLKGHIAAAREKSRRRLN